MSQKGFKKGQPTEAKADYGFGLDALASTSGLELVLHVEPEEHQRRLLDALEVDWRVDLDARCSRDCDCKRYRDYGPRA